MDHASARGAFQPDASLRERRGACREEGRVPRHPRLPAPLRGRVQPRHPRAGPEGRHVPHAQARLPEAAVCAQRVALHAASLRCGERVRAEHALRLVRRRRHRDRRVQGEVVEERRHRQLRVRRQPPPGHQSLRRRGHPDQKHDPLQHVRYAAAGGHRLRAGPPPRKARADHAAERALEGQRGQRLRFLLREHAGLVGARLDHAQKLLCGGQPHVRVAHGGQQARLRGGEGMRPVQGLRVRRRAEPRSERVRDSAWRGGRCLLRLRHLQRGAGRADAGRDVLRRYAAPGDAGRRGGEEPHRVPAHESSVVRRRACRVRSRTAGYRWLRDGRGRRRTSR